MESHRGQSEDGGSALIKAFTRYNPALHNGLHDYDVIEDQRDLFRIVHYPRWSFQNIYSFSRWATIHRGQKFLIIGSASPQQFAALYRDFTISSGVIMSKGAAEIREDHRWVMENLDDVIMEGLL